MPKKSLHPSIAVLPFRNLSQDKTLEYFSDGISEEIIHKLARLGNIQVASRTSSFYFKHKEISLEEIAQKLQVQFILEGSVRVAKKQARISVQLTNAQNGFLQWSENFDRSLEGMLELQDEIANLIATQFLKFSAHYAEKDSSKTQHQNSKAYDFYLKGLYYYNRYTMDNLEKAISYYEKAIKIQPDYAEALAGLAICNMGLGGYINPSYYEKAKIYALKAISIDFQLIEPHLSLAAILMTYHGDLETALIHIKTALKINPFSSDAHRMYGIYFLRIGNLQNAIYEHELATKYDPLNIIFLRGLGLFQSFAGQYEEAKRSHEYTLELDPNFHPAWEAMGWLCVYQKDWKKAIECFQTYQKMVGHPLKGWAALGYAYGKVGTIEGARKILNTIELRQKTFPKEQLDCNFALVYLGLNDLDKTFYHLERAVENKHIITALFLPNDPIYKAVKKDPRYISLLEKLNVFPSNERSLSTKNNSQVLNLKAETKESLSVLVNHLLYIEAQGNYAKIVWQEGENVLTKQLRISLSNLQKQIAFTEILQCHRSFLVNLQHFQILKGNAKNAMLCTFDGNHEIPVSRNKIAEIKAFLN